MKNWINNGMLNDVLTGLMVAATFSLIAPHVSLAQTLSAVAKGAQSEIMTPFVELSSYVAYGMGTVMTVAGIAGVKKHADNATSNPLAPALGKLAAGAAFLSAPSVAGVLAGTAASAGVTGTSAFKAMGN